MIFNSFNTFFPVVLCLDDGDGQRGRKPGAKGQPHDGGGRSHNSKEIMGLIAPDLHMKP